MGYARPLFGGAPKSRIASLQWIQNRAVRASTSSSTIAKTPQLIQESFDVMFVSVFNRCMNNPWSEELLELVPDTVKHLRSTCRSTARLVYLEQGISHQKYLKTSFTRQSVPSWNSLTAEVGNYQDWHHIISCDGAVKPVIKKKR